MDKRNLIKYLLIAAGIFSTALGVIGIFVPLLPTTPLLLLAAACFMRSSDRLYTALIRHKVLGIYIKNYMDKKGIPIRIKLFSITILWAGILSSAVFATDKLWLRILLVTIAIAVSIHIILIKKKD
ncbi:MAG TPA: YbaN family protein [Bacteroidales bacterium]|nr:YbaN family protein [Bacteroidales bacterium]HQP03228.1 YbaN family protein [Bacteroidales bacterium]